MDFGLNDEQLMLQDVVRQFLEKECPPPRVHEIFDADAPFDARLWEGMSELGLAGIALPERYGGAGLELLDLALTAEVLGHQAAAGPFLGHALAGLAILLGGSDAQREKWLPAIASGRCIASVALAETSGWDPEDWRLEATGGRLSGGKGHVLLGGHADLLVVGVAGSGLVLVEAGADGLGASEVDSLDRTRRLWNVEFSSTSCDPLPEGRAVAHRIRDAGLCLLAADAFGGATRTVEMSMAYAKEREQFGVTVAHFQALKHQLVDMATAVEPCRGLYWYAAHAWDALPDESPRLAALAKAQLTECFAQTGRDAVEAHGAIGFTWEANLQIWVKRSIFDRNYLGSPIVHRERAAQLAGW